MLINPQRRCGEFSEEDDTQQDAVDPDCASRERAEHEAARPRPASERGKGDEKLGAAAEELDSRTWTVQIRPRPVVEIQPEIDRTGIRPRSRDDAEQHAERDNQRGESNPGPPLGPRQQLTAADEAEDFTKRARAARAGFFEVSPYDVTLVRLEQSRHQIGEAPAEPIHEAPLRGAHDTPRLTRATAL